MSENIAENKTLQPAPGASGPAENTEAKSRKPLSLDRVEAHVRADMERYSFGEYRRVQIFCIMALTFIALGAVAYLLRDVMMPFVFAVFLTFVLKPIVRIFNSKLHMPRVLAILVTLLLALCLVAWLSVYVYSSFMELAGDINDYGPKVQQVIDKVADNAIAERLGMDKAKIVDTVGASVAETVGNMLKSLTSGVFSFFSNGTIVAIYMMFLMFSSKFDFKEGESGVWSQISNSIESYIFVKTILSAFVAALTWLILASLGVRMAPVVALLAFAFNFIPNVGPIVAAFLPIPIMVISGQHSFFEISLAVILPGIVHFVVGHLLEPNVMGKSLELDPVVILFGLMLFGVLWGPVGMLLSMPLLVVARILFDQTTFTRPLVGVLAGKMPTNDEGEKGE